MLNLPRRLSSKTSLLVLGGVIHGPTAPKDLNPFLLVVLDDLLDGYAGITTRNPRNPNETAETRCLDMITQLMFLPGFGLLVMVGTFQHCQSAITNKSLGQNLDAWRVPCKDSMYLLFRA